MVISYLLDNIIQGLPIHWATFNKNLLCLMQWQGKINHLSAMVTRHNSAVWPAPYACAQPYHPGSGSHMDSCFVLVRTHQHGIARRKGLTEDHRPRRLLPRRVQNHSFKRQLHSVNDETAVHGCHCPGDMAVRMRTVLAIPRSCVV